MILEYKLEDDKPKEPKENQYENVQVRELAKSMFVTDIKIIDSSDNVPDNYIDKSIYIYYYYYFFSFYLSLFLFLLLYTYIIV